MKKLITLIVAAALVVGALNFHFIYLGKRVKNIEKNEYDV